MEISRNITAGYSAPAESVASPKVETSEQAPKVQPVGPKPEPRLEQLQEAIRALPDIDLEQVAAIKKALAKGELSADVKVLAHSILAYHRGSDI
jgi:negative regulator of flagellin synthesis FlgM